MGHSSSSEVLLFKDIKAYWGLIDVTQYMSEIEEQMTAAIFSHRKEDILNFAEVQLQESQLRDDYREFVDLAIVFLRGSSSHGVKFTTPGAMHHAQ